MDSERTFVGRMPQHTWSIGLTSGGPQPVQPDSSPLSEEVGKDHVCPVPSASSFSRSNKEDRDNGVARTVTDSRLRPASPTAAQLSLCSEAGPWLAGGGGPGPVEVRPWRQSFLNILDLRNLVAFD